MLLKPFSLWVAAATPEHRGDLGDPDERVSRGLRDGRSRDAKREEQKNTDQQRREAVLELEPPEPHKASAGRGLPVDAAAPVFVCVCVCVGVCVCESGPAGLDSCPGGDALMREPSQ